MASLIVIKFGRRIAAERWRRGWSRDELAAKAGVGRAAIGNLEHGKRGCTLDTAASLAAVLGISLDGLTGPCGQCRDTPLPGYTCNACGASGPEPQP